LIETDHYVTVIMSQLHTKICLNNLDIKLTTPMLY